MRNTARLRGTLVALALIGLAASAARPARAAEETGSDAPWLGVYTQTLTDELRDAMDLTGDGALVSRVVDGSPADRAGIEKGDLIVRLGPNTVRSSEDLVRLVRSGRVGSTITVQVRRGGSTRTLSARLEARPENLAPEPEMERERGGEPGDDPRGGGDIDRSWTDEQGRKHRIIVRRNPGGGESGDIDIPNLRGLERLRDMHDLPDMFVMRRGRLGVQVQSLSGQLGEYFDVPDGKGVLVTEVVKDSPAERAGLRAGDVITRVGDDPVGDASSLIRALRDKEGRVRVTVLRKGQTQTFEPELEKPARSGRRMGESLAPIPPEPPAAPAPGMGRDDLEQMREQMRQMREEIRELRRQLDEARRDR